MNILASYIVYGVIESVEFGWVQVIANSDDPDENGITLVIVEDAPTNEVEAMAKAWKDKLLALFPGADIELTIMNQLNQ
jgi:hypothetical protein